MDGNQPLPVSSGRPSSANEFTKVATEKLNGIDTTIDKVSKDVRKQIIDMKSIMTEVDDLQKKVVDTKVKLQAQMSELSRSFLQPQQISSQVATAARYLQKIKQTSTVKIAMLIVATVFFALCAYSILTLLVDSLKDKRPDFLKDEDGVVIGIAIVSGLVPLGIAAVLYMKRNMSVVTV